MFTTTSINVVSLGIKEMPQANILSLRWYTGRIIKNELLYML